MASKLTRTYKSSNGVSFGVAAARTVARASVAGHQPTRWSGCGDSFGDGGTSPMEYARRAEQLGLSHARVGNESEPIHHRLRSIPVHSGTYNVELTPRRKRSASNRLRLAAEMWLCSINRHNVSRGGGGDNLYTFYLRAPSDPDHPPLLRYMMYRRRHTVSVRYSTHRICNYVADRRDFFINDALHAQARTCVADLRSVARPRDWAPPLGGSY